MRARDTSLEAHRVQIRLLREASITRRSALMSSLSGNAIALSRRALQRAHPELSADEVLLRWVALHYGSDLAEGVRQRLSR